MLQQFPCPFFPFIPSVHSLHYFIFLSHSFHLILSFISPHPKMAKDTGWRTKKQPSLSVNGNKHYIINNRTTNVILHENSYFVIIKEC
jgi:hypothetical protein